MHNRPSISQTLLLPNLYVKPLPASSAAAAGRGLPLGAEEERRVSAHFEDFFEDVFEECARHGELELLSVCENTADHMAGNVYAKFRDEDGAAAAMAALAGRCYEGRPIAVEFSPVTDFREATCRQHDDNKCDRGGNCNFMHLRHPGRMLRARVYGRQRDRLRERERERDLERGRERERGRHRGRSRSRSQSRSRSLSRERENSEERRARIAQWSRSRREGGD